MSEHLEMLARALWQARTSGGQVPAAAAAELASPGDAYRVQRIIESLAPAPRFGWKVGATSEAAQRSLDADGPVTAPMHTPFCFESPAVVSVFPGQSASVECEFAFRFSRRLPARAAPYGLNDVLEAVGGVLPAIEVVAGRFEDGLSGIGQLRLIADTSAHTAFVYGPERTDWRAVDAKSHRVSLYRNGALARDGIGSNALGRVHRGGPGSDHRNLYRNNARRPRRPLRRRLRNARARRGRHSRANRLISRQPPNPGHSDRRGHGQKCQYATIHQQSALRSQRARHRADSQVPHRRHADAERPRTHGPAPLLV